MKILYILIIIIALRFPWISITSLLILTSYFVWNFEYGSLKAKKQLDLYRAEIYTYFSNVELMSTPSEILNYIKQNSYFFLNPKSLIMSHQLIGIVITSIIIAIIQFDGFLTLYNALSILIIFTSVSYAMKYQKPITDNTVARNSVAQGIGIYSNFFNNGEWQRMKQKKTSLD